MISDRLSQIGQGLASINQNSFHYWRSAPKGVKSYIVWAENNEGNSFSADNHKQRQVIEGSIDLFTKNEFDAQVEEIQELLEELGVAWNLESVQYEEETGFIHHEWMWRMR